MDGRDELRVGRFVQPGLGQERRQVTSATADATRICRAAS